MEKYGFIEKQLMAGIKGQRIKNIAFIGAGCLFIIGGIYAYFTNQIRDLEAFLSMEGVGISFVILGLYSVFKYKKSIKQVESYDKLQLFGDKTDINEAVQTINEEYREGKQLYHNERIQPKVVKLTIFPSYLVFQGVKIQLIPADIIERVFLAEEEEHVNRGNSSYNIVTHYLKIAFQGKVYAQIVRDKQLGEEILNVMRNELHIKVTDK